MSTLTPVAPRERVLVLDVLRGFALCGVLIGNTFWLYSLRMLQPSQDTRLVDRAAHWIMPIFVESKAQTLLTLLFGFGFAVQLLRAQARNEPVLALYVRRLVVLFGFGALHVMLWWGDVTWTYAVAGFGLLLFQRASNRTRLVWAAILTFVPVLVCALPPVRRATVGLFVTREQMDHAGQALLAAAHGHRFWPVVPAHVRFAAAWEGPIWAWYYAWLLGRFLVGYVAGRQRWFDEDGAAHLPLFRKLFVYGFAAALLNLAVMIPMMLRHPRLGVAGQLGVAFVEQLGLAGMTAFYVAAVVLLMQRPAWRRLLALIAPAGRMPLTTYISQSVISTFLFYGWGLGLAGHVGAAGCIAIPLVVFAVQVALARLWLRRFRFGPLEWVWRALVYLQRPPMLA